MDHGLHESRKRGRPPKNGQFARKRLSQPRQSIVDTDVNSPPQRSAFAMADHLIRSHLNTSPLSPGIQSNQASQEVFQIPRARNVCLELNTSF